MASIASLSSAALLAWLHADENCRHPAVLNEPDSFRQREARRIAIARPILRLQIVGQRVADRSLQRFSRQATPPVARMTEHLEMRDFAGPALVTGYRNNSISDAQAENS